MGKLIHGPIDPIFARAEFVTPDKAEHEVWGTDGPGDDPALFISDGGENTIGFAGTVDELGRVVHLVNQAYAGLAGGIAGEFTPADIEVALRVLAQAYDDDPHDILSEREKDVAARVRRAFAPPDVADRVAEWGIGARIRPYVTGRTLDTRELENDLCAWDVTLTLDGRDFRVVTVVADDEEVTAVDALREARANAISFREFEDDPEWMCGWTAAQQAEMKADADAFVAWLGDERYAALLDETEDEDN